jgi:hypothetical protein
MISSGEHFSCAAATAAQSSAACTVTAWRAEHVSTLRDALRPVSDDALSDAAALGAGAILAALGCARGAAARASTGLAEAAMSEVDMVVGSPRRDENHVERLCAGRKLPPLH